MKKRYNNYENNERTLEQELAESEMCDICCRTFNYQFIKRIPYIGKSGTKYTIRCCPYCKIDDILWRLP